MAGFNFGQIGNIISSVMDTDLLDIGRRMEITNPDGSIGETDPQVPIYRNVPCHIEFNTTDNANPANVDTVPVIISITIHCNLYVDLENNDYVYAKKMSFDNKVLETYTGVVGFNRVEQSRKSVQLSMNRNV